MLPLFMQHLLNKLSYCYGMLTCHLSSRVTYIKKLDTVTSVNSHAIANLPGIIKDVMIKSDSKFKQIMEMTRGTNFMQQL